MAPAEQVWVARQRPGRPKELIVVEGYLDVASLVQHGIENVVATLGTATTPENIRRLTRLTDRVLFCFDGDTAGRTLPLELVRGGRLERLEVLIGERPRGH